MAKSLKLSILTQLLAFARKISLFSVGLCADRYILAGDPRHGANYQSRDTRNHESCCVAAAAATPAIKLAVEMMLSLAPRAPPLSITRSDR
jgi:hypothetical protein